ncbi:dihydropteroate synthase [Caenispirillum bisanense]|uniref:dihydropteroate synthase n=1 Tax=Caenispirillum bisanense TaxID=414052 RepID=UPI0031CFC28E
MQGSVTNRLEESPALPRGFSLSPSGPADDGAADIGRRLYLAPAGLVTGNRARALVAAGRGRPLAGRAELAFGLVAVLLRRPQGGATVTLCDEPTLTAWAAEAGPDVAAHVAAGLERLSAPRPPFAGLAMDRPHVMGILNVTPDSFSDGGDRFAADTAIADGLAMLEAGATLLDVGGESTRPGSQPVPPDEEIRRVVPVVRALAERGACVSIDTRNAATMAAAVAAGARIVNDVTALTWDAEALATVARLRVPVVLMHIRGEPQTMQQNPVYDVAPLDVFDWLGARAAAALAAGVAAADICLDPGIGFGKTLEHNLDILAWAGVLHGHGLPLLLGLSRKTFIARLSRDEPPKQRLAGTIAADQTGLANGFQIVRVHDVAEARQACAVWRGVACA